MSVEEIESVVADLSSVELARFSEWFEMIMSDQWDRQIEQDMNTGCLDKALQRASNRYQAGRCTLL